MIIYTSIVRKYIEDFRRRFKYDRNYYGELQFIFIRFTSAFLIWRALGKEKSVAEIKATLFV